MFILLNWVKYYTKETTKALKIMSVGFCIIGTMILIKYKPAYEVTLGNECLGYVTNQEKIELKIKSDLEDTAGNVAFKEQTVIPEYQLKLINRGKQTQEEEVLLAMQKTILTTYKTYAVTVDGANQAIVASEEEAKNIVETMKADINAEAIGLNVGIVEQYTTDLNVQTTQEASNQLNTIKVAKITQYNTLQEQKRKAEEEEAKKKVISNKTVKNVGTIAGMSLSRPVSGSITSRYGSRSSIRSSSHTGLDIATSAGTPVIPIAPGTVTYADYKGSYGNLVIINHGNGIESYYAHCSKIYCQVGQKVEADTVISAVGSTGNSTGPHLHLEIRQNGNTLNPENYLY